MTRRLLLALLPLTILPSILAADEPPVLVPTATIPDLSGDWSGYWISFKNGHRGPLRATFTRMNDSCYSVRFKGRFAKIVPFRYRTSINVVGSGEGVVMLSASRQLGPLLGTFTMTATGTATTFDAEFNSKNDCGRFVLTRSCGR